MYVCVNYELCEVNIFLAEYNKSESPLAHIKGRYILKIVIKIHNKKHATFFFSFHFFFHNL